MGVKITNDPCHYLSTASPIEQQNKFDLIFKLNFISSMEFIFVSQCDHHHHRSDCHQTQFKWKTMMNFKVCHNL